MLDPVTDLSALAEQLCRVEHKLDLIIHFLATQNGEFQLTKLKEGVDPITQEQVVYYMDLFKRHVVRRASDGTGLLPPASVLFNQPQNNQSQGSNNGGNESGGNVG